MRNIIIISCIFIVIIYLYYNHISEHYVNNPPCNLECGIINNKIVPCPPPCPETEEIIPEKNVV